MLSEFGSKSLHGATCPDDVLGSEVYHAVMTENAYDTFKKLPEIVGYCPWLLLDYRSPLQWRWYDQGKATNCGGLCNEYWIPKKAYESVKKKVRELKAIFG